MRPRFSFLALSASLICSPLAQAEERCSDEDDRCEGEGGRGLGRCEHRSGVWSTVDDFVSARPLGASANAAVATRRGLFVAGMSLDSPISGSWVVRRLAESGGWSTGDDSNYYSRVRNQPEENILDGHL